MKPWLIMIPFLLTGCGTPGSGIRWWAPTTWFSGKAVHDTAKAIQRETQAETAAVKLAQKASHETQIALGFAGESRPVAVARESSSTAVALLDQAAGPLTAPELSKMRETITGLLSENAEVREAAERERTRNAKGIADISRDLAKAREATDKAERDMRLAFERENKLANDLRAQRMFIYILAALALVGFAGWVYLRFFLGGLPGAMGSVLSRIETKNPVAAEELRNLLDMATNRHEQALIRREYLKQR
jgi:hypothetical protein